VLYPTYKERCAIPRWHMELTKVLCDRILSRCWHHPDHDFVHDFVHDFGKHTGPPDVNVTPCILEAMVSSVN
jgi:hypothetical protein